LKKEIKPGDLLVVSDFIDFNPPTFYDRSFKFIVPQISEKLRKALVKILKKLKLKFWPNGIYFNSKGPRLETKAEIKLIKNFADVIGMTMAKEATLANEIGLEYAALCSVDNYGHGISNKPLTQKEFEKSQKKNRKILEKIMVEILKSKI
jgi:5'-methylthioadenosine phosphorylase